MRGLWGRYYYLYFMDEEKRLRKPRDTMSEGRRGCVSPYLIPGTGILIIRTVKFYFKCQDLKFIISTNKPKTFYDLLRLH